MPRTGHVAWEPAPKIGAISVAAVPHWLAVEHKQLVQLRDVASVPLESRDETRKDTTMTVRPEDVGNGALLRNEMREKPSQPETMDGKRYWVALGSRRRKARSFSRWCTARGKQVVDHKNIHQGHGRISGEMRCLP